MKLRLILFVLFAALITTNASAQVEYLENGSSVVGIDTSGKGAVLCMWEILIVAQALGEPCAVARQPIDDEIDDGIERIDAFIMENAKRFPATRASLAAQKIDIVKEQLDALAHYPEMRSEVCLVPAAFHGAPPWPQTVRQLVALGLRGSVDKLLSVPREPVMNPCL